MFRLLNRCQSCLDRVFFASQPRNKIVNYDSLHHSKTLPLLQIVPLIQNCCKNARA